MTSADTIYACATGPLASALAVIRISGPDARQALLRFTKKNTLSMPRVAHYTVFTDPVSGELLDTGLSLWFPGPNSFTGEDSAEWQVHGSPANVRRCLHALSALPGFRLAEAGEFSRRALLHGKAGLLELEGLADLLAADTEAQAKHASLQMSSGSAVFLEYRRRLIHATALIEAFIDFPEEEDIPDDIKLSVKHDIDAIHTDMKALLAGAASGRRMREGANAVLFGAPNAGKSTLLNILTASETAIVSDIPGTTRDAIRVRLDIGGYPVNLIDTAGLRNSVDAIEQEGVRRARALISSADIALAVCDISAPLPEKTLREITADTLIICNKTDTKSDFPRFHDTAQHVYVSAKTSPEETANTVISAMNARMADMFSVYGAAMATRDRHRQCLTEATEALEQFDSDRLPPEICAEYLRRASFHIGAVAGFTETDDVLDVLFREFCIGK